MAKRHKRSRIWGMRLVTCGTPDNFGLITLCGNRHRPQAFQTLAGTGQTPAVKNVGEP